MAHSLVHHKSQLNANVQVVNLHEQLHPSQLQAKEELGTTHVLHP